MTAIVVTHAEVLGIAAVCAALGIARASFYRWLAPQFGPRRPHASPRALSADERQQVLDVLHEDRFMDLAPSEVYATLLDEGRYLCSERTIYRLLQANHEVRERRDQLRHPGYAAPQLLATRPNELWSWDITKLLGPAKWTYYHLYVILDVFSRYVVGWMVAVRESAHLAEKLIRETCERQHIARDRLTIHADRGSSMTSKSVALLLADLGVAKTHSRPHVSDDNPFSESLFKTFKYRPGFPERFGSVEDARQQSGHLLDWYNHHHRHGGIALLTPADVHFGRSIKRIEARAVTLGHAHAAHPERFVRGAPTPPSLPLAVWINKPKTETAPTDQSRTSTGSTSTSEIACEVSPIASEHATADTPQAVPPTLTTSAPCAVPPRNDSRRIAPRRNATTEPTTEEVRH